MNDYLNRFKFIKLSMNLIAIDPIRLPVFKGSSIRGVFGHAFKKIFCTIGQNVLKCNDCPKNSSCYYSYVFETPVLKNSDIMKKYTNAPHPFVIVPPITDKCSYAKGETFNFEIVLIGNAIEYLSCFVNIFNEMGISGIGKGNGRFFIESINSIDEKNNNKKIFDGRNYKFIDEPYIIDFSKIETPGKNGGVDRIKVKYITPTSIKFEEKITRKIEFHHLVRNLLRKFSHLYYFHVDKKVVNMDFNGYIEKALKVKTDWSDLQFSTVTRFSNRQLQKMDIEGIVGEAEYKGDLKDFMKLLKLGEYTNAGKGTSFGLGKYSVEY